MKINIPSVGDRLELTKPWTFDVWSERRNEALGKALGLKLNTGNSSHKVQQWVGQASEPYEKKYSYDCTEMYEFIGYDVIVSGQCTLAKGTVLTVDRIYIRKGAEDYDSISFLINNSKDARFKVNKKDEKRAFNKGRIRFWVKLDDANSICYKPYQYDK